MKISYKNLVSCIVIALIIFIFPVEAKTNKTVLFDFDFSINNRNWQGEYADYPVGEEFFYELTWGWASLPTALTLVDRRVLTKGMFLAGNNHSDDLFMYLRRKIAGLQPNSIYDLTFNVTIENNIPPGQFGIGGSPGESVYFKVGASKRKPRKVDVDGFYLLNVDKGEQSNGGKNAIVVGNLANPSVNPNDPQFESKNFTNGENPLRVKTDNNGQLWLFLGTDSGFEGPTLYYIAHIAISAVLVH